MKMSKIISLILVVVMVLATFVACFPQNDNNDDEGKKPVSVPEYTQAEIDELVAAYAGDYTITMWVSDVDGVKEQFEAQIEAFEAKFPGINITATIDKVGEGDAGAQVIADVVSAPDLYCFAQDQLAGLVQASAIAAPPSKIASMIKESNDSGAIGAGTVGDKLYAYPYTSDNGFYMFYDKSLFPNEEDLDSMEKIIEICEANGKTFRFPLDNAWYNAGFFFATGCESLWTADKDGNFVDVKDTYNSDAGLVAMKGMQKLAQSKCYNPKNDDYTDFGVCVTGTWAADGIKDVLGDNYAATDLPSFTVDGKSYHIGSYTGNKLMGVKPQVGDEKKAAVLALLAQFLTNADCQQQRFEEFNWGPSNIKVQASDAVQSDVALAAFALQSDYGKPQGQIHSGWWNVAAALGANAKDYTAEADLKGALVGYENAVKALLEQ